MNISHFLIGLVLTLSSVFLFYKEFKRKNGKEDDPINNYLGRDIISKLNFCAVDFTAITDLKIFGSNFSRKVASFKSIGAINCISHI
jgi:hypothetical protein